MKIVMEPFVRSVEDQERHFCEQEVYGLHIHLQIGRKLLRK